LLAAAYNSAMTGSTPPTTESDDRFPSGPWEGYFLQRSLDGTKRKMELALTFREGRVTGDGRDGVGPFTLAGGYETADGKVWWTKRYPFHAVYYQGYAEAKGIWGIWEIPPIDRDGFHIWPRGHGTGDEQAEHRAATPPVIFEEEALECEPLVAGRV
jgi:hypothetical protein